MSYRKRANQYADLIIEKKLSIREVAKIFEVSKSTVHRYISLFTTGADRKRALHKQLGINFDTMHIKGGAVTKEKYRKMREVRSIK